MFGLMQPQSISRFKIYRSDKTIVQDLKTYLREAFVSNPKTVVVFKCWNSFEVEYFYILKTDGKKDDVDLSDLTFLEFRQWEFVDSLSKFDRALISKVLKG